LAGGTRPPGQPLHRPADGPPPPDKLGEELKLSYIARFCDSPESLFLIQKPLSASTEIRTRSNMRLRVKSLNRIS
jgi:hypothetical protein